MTQNDLDTDRKNLPIIAGISIGEVQMMLEEALVNVLWDDGLVHLASISTSLRSIAMSLETIVDALKTSPAETES